MAIKNQSIEQMPVNSHSCHPILHIIREAVEIPVGFPSLTPAIRSTPSCQGSGNIAEGDGTVNSFPGVATISFCPASIRCETAPSCPPHEPTTEGSFSPACGCGGESWSSPKLVLRA